MQRHMHISEKNFDISDKEAYAGKIADFTQFASKTLP
jgi:hypothetical protein